MQEVALADVKHRLAKVEGQVRGLQRMIVEGRQCKDILIQMSAVLGALKQAGALLAACSVQEQLAAALESGASPEDISYQIVEAFARMV